MGRQVSAVKPSESGLYRAGRRGGRAGCWGGEARDSGIEARRGRRCRRAAPGLQGRRESARAGAPRSHRGDHRVTTAHRASLRKLPRPRRAPRAERSARCCSGRVARSSGARRAEQRGASRGAAGRRESRCASEAPEARRRSRRASATVTDSHRASRAPAGQDEL